jgi:hypothetical protein
MNILGIAWGENSKSEARNPKKKTMFKFSMTETRLLCFEHSNFRFVSDFEIRISDFASIAGKGG